MDTGTALSLLSVLMFQVGSRQIQFEFTEAQRQFFKHPATHFIVVLSMFYMGTRRWLWAFTLVLMYYISLHILLNENSPYNLFSRKWLRENGFISEAFEENKIELYYNNLKKLPL
jgi:hypothetical protein